jgi:hypothetical protein
VAEALAGPFPTKRSGQLRDILRESGMALVVETIRPTAASWRRCSASKAACRVNQLPITLTFDMGNWLWVGDSPEEAARHWRLPSAIFM